MDKGKNQKILLWLLHPEQSGSFCLHLSWTKCHWAEHTARIKIEKDLRKQHELDLKSIYFFTNYCYSISSIGKNYIITATWIYGFILKYVFFLNTWSWSNLVLLIFELKYIPFGWTQYLNNQIWKFKTYSKK